MAIDKEPQKQKGDSFESTTTPTSNETITHAVLGPKYVIPIIFIPGIMGSNIMNDKGKKVWFPPNGILAGAGAAFHGKFFRSASNRQTELDPATTFVSNEGDIKINKKAIKGFGENEARARGWGTVYWDGYGEGMVFLEQFLNSQLIRPQAANSSHNEDRDGFAGSEPWQNVTEIPEATAQQKDELKQIFNPAKVFEFLKKEEFEKLADYAFPVFALGYNWLQCNSDSAISVKERLNSMVKPQIAKEFPKATFKKYIIVTHSMGGLVTRALIQDGEVAGDILGVIHGVMPASGAPTVYKRLANGWDGKEVTGNFVDSIAKHVFGATSAKLTPVLGNAPGGLELLPFPNFMTTYDDNPTVKVKPWLKLIAKNKNGKKITATLPKSDPYSEIYYRTDTWWRMINTDFLDPNQSIRNEAFPKSEKMPIEFGNIAEVKAQQEAYKEVKKPTKYDVDLSLQAAFSKTLTVVEIFHDKIADSYHDNCYAHYGNDPRFLAFSEVVWETDQILEIETEDDLIEYTGITRPISTENTTSNATANDTSYGSTTATGTSLHKMPTIVITAESSNDGWDKELFNEDGERRIKRDGKEDVVFKLRVAPNTATGAGDGTVCHQSAQDVLRDKILQVFEINGYDHANSYKNPNVLHSVLFSVAKLMNKA